MLEHEDIKPKKQSPEDMLTMATALNAFFGGTVEVNDN